MARIRSVKPEYWTSEQVMNCTRDARCMFIGLWNFSDDGGNHPASVKTLKAEVFPGDDDATMEAMMRWIDELIEQGLLAEYEVDGKEFWHVTGWHHQRIDQPTLRHPAGDTVTQGDARHPKRVGGKQRQLLIRKLRERDGDTCHLCGDTPGVTLLRVTEPSPENPHDIRTYRLVCTSCRKKRPSGDAEVTQGDARCLAGDSLTESSLVESSGEEGSKPKGTVIVSGIPVTQQVTRVTTDDDFIPKDEAEWLRHLKAKHGFEANPTDVNDRKRYWKVLARWVNAGVRTSQIDKAIAKAYEDSKDPISNIVAYADRVLETLSAPKKPKVDAWDRTPEGVLRKSREIGFGDGRRGETTDQLRERIYAELQRRAQPEAAA
ncbi:hypothetical protein [Paraburkholderia caribensis]|uniref:hypothetical protein n=1 Tax=Paraburkholderia caribensis TaxID=75105 RepID=UPI001CB64436|nr:hypothetical protein [Paraburkholderia caribensis]CAG9255912.1 conserved hypothetical protein [Paraburkholderia caribensis]